MSFRLRVITPTGLYFKGKVDILNIKTLSGYIGVMKNHLPYVSMLDIAPMSYKISSENFDFALGGGILNVTRREVIVIASSIESAAEIDPERAILAKERAEKSLKAISKEDIEINRVEFALKRAMTRLLVKGTKD